VTNIPDLKLSDDDKAALNELQLSYDKDEAAKMKEHADLLLLKRRLHEFNEMCDAQP
jgi:hypothetical protein